MRPLVWIVLGLSAGALFQGRAKAEKGFAVVQTARGSQLHLYAPISVNGSRIVWFGVDTGAPVSLISPAVRRALSLPAASSPETLFLSGGSSKTTVVLAQSVRAMDLELGPGYFVEAPILFDQERTFEARIPFDKEGLIGMNFLLDRGAVINCRTQQIFFSRDSAKLPLSHEKYERMGFTYLPIRITARKFAEVEGTVAGSTYSFVIDTGSVWTSLEPVILDRTHASYHYSTKRFSLPYGGVRSAPFKLAKIPGLKLGIQDMSDLLLGSMESRTHDFGVVHEYGGLIGADLLFKRHAIIDLGNRALYLMADKR